MHTHILQDSDFTKVKRFIKRNTVRNQVQDTPIVKDVGDNELYVGMYHIEKCGCVWVVTKDDCTIELNSKRNAMYYAFLSFYGKYAATNSLITLDSRLALRKADVDRYHHLIDTAPDTFKLELYCNKLSEAESRFNEIRAEMRRWVSCAKYIKLH